MSQESEISHLKEDIAALRTRLSERNEAISRLEADAALLSHVRQSMRERQTRIDGLKLQLDHMRDALQKTEAELAEAKRFAAAGRDEQARERDAEIASLKAELESVRSNLTERNNDISRLEADAALLSHVRQSMRERQTRIDGLTLQLSNARKELAEAQAATGTVDAGQVDRLRAELQDRDEQLAAWESRYEASVGELQERIRELESKPATAVAVGAAPAEVQAKLRLATMRGIQFRPDSDEIDPASVAILEGAVDALRHLDGGSTVEIAGHTDAWGDDMANLHLSERRARAVREFLVAHGVDGAKLMTRGYGGSRPIADNLTADGRYANRRIEFVVRG
jgi:outer membrane protein OmpA-like peptidoglycan-associated protein